MANTLAIAVTADIVQLQVAFSQAKAETNALTAELNKLSKASASGQIVDPAKLEEAARNMLTAKLNAQQLAAQLQATGVSATSLGKSIESSHGSISTATREFRALFDELSSGRTRQTPGTIAILLQRVAGLGPASLGAVGGVLALAGGLAYLVYQAVAYSNALDNIQLGAQFSGNVDLARDRIEAFAQQMRAAGNITKTDALAIADSLARIPGMTDPAFQAISAMMNDFVRQSGIAADKIPEELKKMFDPEISAAKATQEIKGHTQAMMELAGAADRSGNANQVLAAKVVNLSQSLQAGIAAEDAHDSILTRSLGTFVKYIGAIDAQEAATEAGISTQEVEQTAIEETNTLRARSNALLQEGIRLQSVKPPTPEQTVAVGMQAAEKENPVVKQIEDAQKSIGEMNAALETLQARAKALDMGGFSDQAQLAQHDVDLLKASIEKANEALGTLQYGPVLTRMHDAMEKAAADSTGLQSQMLQQQYAIAASALTQVGTNAKERVEIETQMSHLLIEIHKAEGTEILAAARETNTRISGDTTRSALERLQAERDSLVQALANTKLMGAARVEAEKELHGKEAEISRTAAAEQVAIDRENAQTQTALATLALDQKKQILDEEVAAHRISAEQKREILRELAAEEFALTLKSREAELASLNPETAAYARVYGEILQLKAKLGVEMATIDRQYAAEAAAAAKEESAAWKGAVNEIESVESSMINNLLSGRKSFKQTAIAAAQELVTKEIESDVKAMTTRLLLANTEANAQKALEQGGVLYHAGVELRKSLATQTSEAAQTSAAVAGDTARLTSQASTAVASKAISKTTGGSTVMADAAKAYSGTYASVAQIPYVGWILAPAAASVAYTAVAAYEGLASLDTGTNYVPRDMVAQLHQGEAVTPKAYNPAAGGVAAAGATSAVHNYGDIHMSDTNMKRLLASRAGQRMVFDGLAAAYRRGAR